MGSREGDMYVDAVVKEHTSFLDEAGGRDAASGQKKEKKVLYYNILLIYQVWPVV
jgi:hypothetical protein